VTATASYPNWLPEPVEFAGDWDGFVRTLYAIFEADFKHGHPRYQNRPIWHNQRIEAEGGYAYEEGFWHLVTRDQWVWNPATRRKEKERLPDLGRAARLPWSKPAIAHASMPEVLVWDFEQETRRGMVVRSYVWLKNHNFVVILERQEKRRGDIFMLITSFYVDHEGKRIDLASRYERRIR